MGQRIYVANFENVSISAAQDLFSLLSGTGNAIELHQFVLTVGGGITTPAETRVTLKRLPSTVTQGSGGSTPTVSPLDVSDTKAATATVHANDTTAATTTGTAATLLAWQWNELMPLEYLPAPEDRPVCAVSQAFVLSLPAAATITASGFIKWRELP